MCDIELNRVLNAVRMPGFTEWPVVGIYVTYYIRCAD